MIQIAISRLKRDMWQCEYFRRDRWLLPVFIVLSILNNVVSKIVYNSYQYDKLATKIYKLLARVENYCYLSTC